MSIPGEQQQQQQQQQQQKQELIRKVEELETELSQAHKR